MKYLFLFTFWATVLLGNAQVNLQWQSIGPNNYGGVVKSVLLDKRDAARKTVYIVIDGGGIWKSVNGGDDWLPLGCNHNYNANCITQGPDGSVYFGTGVNIDEVDIKLIAQGSGIYKIDTLDQITHLIATTPDSTSGKGWVNVRKIAINPVNANHMLAATRYGMYASYNKGVNWQLVLIPNIGSTQSVWDIEWSSSGNEIFASVGGDNKLARSLDGGATWERLPLNTPGLPLPSGILEVAISNGANPVIYIQPATSVGFTYGVYRSVNLGNTWDTIAEAGPFFDPLGFDGWYTNFLSVYPNNGDKLLIGGAKMYLWTYPDSLVELGYFNSTNLDTGFICHQLAIAFNDLNPDEIYLGTQQGLYKSTVPAQLGLLPNFVGKRNMAASVSTSFDVNRSGNILYANNSLGILETNAQSPGGYSLLDTYGFSGQMAYSTLDTNTSFIYNLPNLLQRRDNAANTYTYIEDTVITNRCSGMQKVHQLSLLETTNAWQTNTTATFVADKAYSLGDTVQVVSGTANKVYSWQLQNALNMGDTVSVPDPVKARLFGISSCGAYMTNNPFPGALGTRWFHMGIGVISVATSADLNVAYLGKADGWVVRYDSLNFMDYDSLYPLDTILPGGFAVKVTGIGEISSLAVSRANKDRLICTVARRDKVSPTFQNFYISTDGGNTWTGKLIGSLDVNALSCVIDVNNENTFVVGTTKGIWVSYDSGNTWQKDADSNFCDVTVTQLHQRTLGADSCPVLYAATKTRGLWRSSVLTPAGCNTFLEIADKAGESPRFKLFPNPADNVLNVQFNAAEGEIATIDIYTVEGKRAYHSGVKCTNGIQHFTYAVNHLQPGIYLVRVSTTKSASVQRFVVK